MKKMFFSPIRMMALFSLLMLLSSCATSSLSSMTPHERVAFDQAMSDNISPSEVIAQAQKKLDEATEAQFDFYAPVALKKATLLVADANAKLMKKGADPKEVILIAIQATQAVDAGFETKSRVEDVLSISLSEKKRLDEVETQALFPLEYKATVTLLNQMIALVEGKKPEQATALQTQFTEKSATLLIKALNKITLDRTRALLTEVQTKDARRYAPMTLEAANVKLTQAETFIRTYPREREKIKEIGEEAFLAATHVQTVTHQVKLIVALEANTMERFVLSLEKQIHHIGSALGQPRVPYGTLRTQLEGLTTRATAIAATASRVPGLEQKGDALGISLGAEQEKTATLEKERTTLQGSLAATTADRDKGKEANTTLGETNADLKKQLEVLNQNIIQMTAEKGAMETQATADAAKALEEITSLKQGIAERDVKLEGAEKEHAQVELLASQLKTLEASNSNFQEKVTRLQSDKVAHLDELSSLKETVNALKAKLETKSAALKKSEGSTPKTVEATAPTPS